MFAVEVNQNLIFVFTVALTDTQAKIPLKHCLYQDASTDCIVSKFHNASIHVFHTCYN